MDLVVECYRLTGSFPDAERFGLTPQLRRSAVSVAANVAEGHGRGTTKSFINFIWIANGSLTELETHILIAERLSFLDKTKAHATLQSVAEIGRILVGLRRSLESKDR